MSLESTAFAYPVPHPQEQRYHLQTLLGSGSFGSVYAGIQESAAGLCREVAIKIIHPEISTPHIQELTQRLRDEGRIQGMLRHRALTTIFDLTRLNDRWAIVMERLHGEDLRVVLRREGTLPVRTTVQVIAELASALGVIHDAVDPDTRKPLHILHRDLKPANVFLTTQGEIKLLDFGVAFAHFERREARTQNCVLGTFNYFSPERIMGRDLPAGDVYALGMIALECLTGLVGDALPTAPQPRHQWLMRRLHHAQTPLPPPLIALVTRMLAQTPEKRPSAQDAAATLRTMLAALEGPWIEDFARITFQHPPLRQNHDALSADRSPAPLPPEPLPTGLMLLLTFGILACLAVACTAVMLSAALAAGLSLS